jgi:sugar fermentation stimulation protein A
LVVTGLPLARMRKHPLRARFVARPNRFAARVILPGGRGAMAHLPNPGRLTGTLGPGCRVLLDGPFPPPRAYPFTLIAAQEPTALVSTVTTYANRLFAYLWRAGWLPELGVGELAAEVPHGSSRFDFKAGGTFVEIKSVTLARQGTAWFPDAVTARGARHCAELASLAKRGMPAAIVFIAQRGDVQAIAPARDIDPQFTRSLRRAAAAGVAVLGCAAEITPFGARRVIRVPVLLRTSPPR